MIAYRIEDTAFRPRRYKIVPQSRPVHHNNSWTEYFRTRAEAVAEIRRRGGRVLLP
jgi:hypothetical protein